MVGQGCCVYIYFFFFFFLILHEAKKISDILAYILLLFSQKRSISNIQQNSSLSSSMKRPTIPYRYVVLLPPLCNYNRCWSNFPAWFSYSPTSGSFVIPVGSHSRQRISPHNAFIPYNEIMRPSLASCINTRTNPIRIHCTAAECSSELITDR